MAQTLWVGTRKGLVRGAARVCRLAHSPAAVSGRTGHPIRAGRRRQCLRCAAAGPLRREALEEQGRRAANGRKWRHRRFRPNPAVDRGRTIPRPGPWTRCGDSSLPRMAGCGPVACRQGSSVQQTAVPAGNWSRACGTGRSGANGSAVATTTRESIRSWSIRAMRRTSPWPFPAAASGRPATAAPTGPTPRPACSPTSCRPSGARTRTSRTRIAWTSAWPTPTCCGASIMAASSARSMAACAGRRCPIHSPARFGFAVAAHPPRSAARLVRAGSFGCPAHGAGGPRCRHRNARRRQDVRRAQRRIAAAQTPGT